MKHEAAIKGFKEVIQAGKFINVKSNFTSEYSWCLLTLTDFQGLYWQYQNCNGSLFSK